MNVIGDPIILGGKKANLPVTVASLAAAINATEFAKLSYMAGSWVKATGWGRQATITSNTPVLFLRIRDSANSQGGGYGAISVVNPVPYTATDWGQLDFVTAHTTANGTPYYCWAMRGIVGYDNPINGVVNGDIFSIPQSVSMSTLSVVLGSYSSPAGTLTLEGTYKDLAELWIDLMAEFAKE